MMRRAVFFLALLACGCCRPETPDQELARLQGERAALARAVAKDTRILYRAQLHYTSARRRRLRGSALERLRAPMVEVRDRIEATKEELAVREQRIALLEAERNEVTEPPAEERPPPGGHPGVSPIAPQAARN